MIDIELIGLKNTWRVKLRHEVVQNEQNAGAKVGSLPARQKLQGKAARTGNSIQKRQQMKTLKFQHDRPGQQQAPARPQGRGRCSAPWSFCCSRIAECSGPSVIDSGEKFARSGWGMYSSLQVSEHPVQNFLSAFAVDAFSFRARQLLPDLELVEIS